MIYTTAIWDAETHSLLDAPEEDRAEQRVSVPAVWPGRAIARHLGPATMDAAPDDRLPFAASTVAAADELEQGVRACSLDITLERFADERMHPLPYPFVLRPGATVYGFSGKQYPGWFDTLLAVETRSSFARRGIACLGFRSASEPAVFLHSGELTFALRNYAPNAYRIDGPFTPVQVTLTNREELASEPPALQIVDNGIDVTRERQILWNGAPAYFTRLADELVTFAHASSPVPLDAAPALAVRGTIADLRADTEFCLTRTQEEVYTNGQPAYMLPFHFLDFTSEYALFDTKGLAEQFSRAFAAGELLPVTANAGLLNPCDNGTVVCENITRGRDIRRYFVPGEPFAIVVPVPFTFNGPDGPYVGNHQNQRAIGF